MAREIGNWASKPDRRASGSEKNDARIAKALEPGETIVARIPLSGLAVDTFNVLFWLVFAGFSAFIIPLTYIANPDQRWFIGPIALAWIALIVWGVWNSFTLPLRSAAVLTDRRVLLVSYNQTQSARRASEGAEPSAWSWPLPDLGIKKLLVQGTRARGSICLGQLTIRRSARRSTTYPPFTLFGVERPLEVAAQINETLKLNLPVTDKTG